MNKILLFLGIFLSQVLCLPLYSFGGPEDFIEDNGKPLELRKPPYFDYDSTACDCNPGSYAERWAKKSLANAIDIGDVVIQRPPGFPRHICGRRSDANKFWVYTYFDRREEGTFERGVVHALLDCSYSEFTEKFEYLFYWFDLCFYVSIKEHERQISRHNEELRKQHERGEDDSHAQHHLNYHKNGIARDKERRDESIKLLTEGLDDVEDILLFYYEECINTHSCPSSKYERGRIFFDQGKTVEFLGDIADLIDGGYALSPQKALEQGKAYNDINQYDQAIKVLSEIVTKDPGNKEAYFERAVAYFETGAFNQALEDYILSEKHPELLRNRADEFSELLGIKYWDFNQGAVIGALKGGYDSVENFVPSLFSTIHGIGKALWAFSGDPIGISTEFFETSIELVKYVKDNLSKELLAKVVPELKECLLKWDQLSSQEKGHSIGYIIGRYGVDILAWNGSARGLKLYRDLKKANAIMTLETATISSMHSEEMIQASKDYFKWREEYKTTCTMHISRQGKHIPSAHNFEKEKGEILIAIERLKEIAKPKHGEGIRHMKTFGEANYREYVDFGEFIGVHVSDITGMRTSTTIGEIHYAKNGMYHIVPQHPDILKIKGLL